MSQINPTNIDGTFPIAGQDNDSQGFRNNFTNISNNFTYARAEIEDLENKVLLKSALSGKTLSNNMNGTVLTGAEIADFRETRKNIGQASALSGLVELVHADGHYQALTLDQNATITFLWSDTDTLCRIRLEVEVVNTAFTMTLPATVNIGTKGIAGLNASNVMSFNQTGTYIFEFTTEDAGVSNIAINDLTRARTHIPTSKLSLIQGTPSLVGATGDVAGMIAVDDNNVYISDANYDGTTPIWRAIKAGTGTAYLNTNVSTTSAALGTITGLSFTALPGVRYKFDSLIPFTHSNDSILTHTFSVFFEGNSGDSSDSCQCYYVIEQQAAPEVPLGNPDASYAKFYSFASSVADSTGSTVTTLSTEMKFAKISGVFTHTEPAPVTLSLRFATDGGTLTALAGSALNWTRVN